MYEYTPKLTGIQGFASHRLPLDGAYKQSETRFIQEPQEKVEE